MSALIAQVIVLQGIHHVIGHHDHGEPCDTSIVHFHSSDHGHFSCDLCVFQFAPSDVNDCELNFIQPELVKNGLCIINQKEYLSQGFFQKYLRGPPALLG